MINLSWLPYPTAIPVHYRVYRSFIGFIAPLNHAATGQTLILKFNGKPAQTFTIGSDIVASINATIVGGVASVSALVPGNFIVRSLIADMPGSVEIVGGTALATFGLTARLITEQSETVMLGQVEPAVLLTTLLNFSDTDGNNKDFYGVSTIDSSNIESALTNLRQPIVTSEPLCVLEGVVMDAQGTRLVDVIVKAKMIVDQNIGAITSTDKLIYRRKHASTRTGIDGRFSLPLLQGAMFQIDIPATEFSRPVKIPAQAFVFINDLITDTRYTYPLSQDMGTAL